MKALDGYLQPRARWRPALVILAIVLIVAAVLMAVASSRRLEQTANYEERNAALRRQIKASQVAPSRTDIEEQRRWATLAAERNFPWSKVFRAVERANDPDIELLEFRPDKRQHAVVLRGEAKSRDGLVRYLDLLHGDPALFHVYLAREATVAHGRLVTTEFEIRAAILD
jgi:hypothetical protein